MPPTLPLDAYEGMCWISVVPFRMSGIRVRGLPVIPGTSEFPELNVRTYVIIDGKPGVYFFSLEAANWLAVKSARTLYHLPYWYADMSMEKIASTIAFQSTRRMNEDVALNCTYEPISAPFQPKKGSFEAWLVERYCFYTINAAGVPLRCDILHEPWTLQHATATFHHNNVLRQQGIFVNSETPVLHFAKEIEVRAWPLVNPTTNRVSL